MIIYLFPDKKNIENFSNKKNIEIFSNTIEEPINDSLIPYNPYAKIQLNEYEIIETFKYILKRTPTIPEINKFMYYSINELKEFLYNSPEYEKLIKIQDNTFNNGIEAAIAKKNLINRIMELYRNVYNNEIPVKMILPLRDCFIYLQLNIYLFIVMLESNNYSFFEDSILSTYILTKKILLELFNKYFNVLELKIYAEEKINKLSAINDMNDDKYLISKIEIANIIKDLIVINNDYLLIKIKSNYPNVFIQILKNTIGEEKLTIDNSDIINLKKYLNSLNNNSNLLQPSQQPQPPPQTSQFPVFAVKIPERQQQFISPIVRMDAVKSLFSGQNIKENYQNNDGGYKPNNEIKTILDYYFEYKLKKNPNINKNDIDLFDKKFFDDFESYDFNNYLRNTDYADKIIFTHYDNFKKNKDNMNISNINYYKDMYGDEFDNYLKSTDYYQNAKANIEFKPINTSSTPPPHYIIPPYPIPPPYPTPPPYNPYNPPNNYIKTPNTDLPFKSNYMNDLVFDEDNKSVLRLYNPIVHNKSYLLPSGYRPPVCTSLGQEQLTQPVFTESKLLFQGLDINKAFTETQVGSIMPKFIYNEFKDIKIK